MAKGWERHEDLVRPATVTLLGSCKHGRQRGRVVMWLMAWVWDWGRFNEIRTRQDHWSCGCVVAPQLGSPAVLRFCCKRGTSSCIIFSRTVTAVFAGSCVDCICSSPGRGTGDGLAHCSALTSSHHTRTQPDCPLPAVKSDVRRQIGSLCAQLSNIFDLFPAEFGAKVSKDGCIVKNWSGPRTIPQVQSGVAVSLRRLLRSILSWTLRSVPA